MTASELLAKKCREDLYTFTRVMFDARKGSEMSVNWHQKAICEALEKVVLGKIKRLIINVPPRSGKTEIAVINFIAWAMGHFPDSEFIHASYSKRLATNNTFQARSLMQHEAYGQIFGEPVFRGDSNAKDEFRTAQGGIVYASGAEGTITGYGAGKMRSHFGGAIIIDDPLKAGDSNSRLMIENCISWFSTTMESRKNSPKDTPIILIMQRLNDRDLTGYLLGGGNGEKWHHINIPAIDESGESFWPAQFPIDDLMRLKETDQYRFAGQYMQAPKVLGGNIIKGEWFGEYQQIPKIEHRYIYADTAQKTKEHNDYSVFQCWGKGDDGKAYMLDQIRGKWEAPDLERRAIAFWQKHKAMDDELGALRGLKIEDKASGTGLIQSIKRGQNIPVTAIQRNKDKYTRLLDVLGYIESGLVMLPTDAPYISDFLHECEAFSGDDSHFHDDQIDPMIDAINDLLVDNSEMDLLLKMMS